MNAVTKSEAMQARQYRLVQEKQQTETAEVQGNPAVVGCIGPGAKERAKTHSHTKQTIFGLMMALAFAFLFGPNTPTVSAQVTLPDTGVDVAEFATAAITALGATVLVIVGGYAAFKLIQLGIAWFSRLGGR